MRTTLALALMGAVLISVPATAQTAGSADTTRANTTMRLPRPPPDRCSK